MPLGSTCPGDLDDQADVLTTTVVLAVEDAVAVLCLDCTVNSNTEAIFPPRPPPTPPPSPPPQPPSSPPSKLLLVIGTAVPACIVVLLAIAAAFYRRRVRRRMVAPVRHSTAAFEEAPQEKRLWRWSEVPALAKSMSVKLLKVADGDAVDDELPSGVDNCSLHDAPSRRP